MTSRESFMVKMIKRMYGVQGVLDEHRRARIDQVGNQAFMIFYLYTPVSLLVATLFMETHPKEALMALVGSTFLLFMIMTGYIHIKTADLKLQEIEVEKKEYAEIKKREIKKSIKQAIFITVTIHFSNALITMIMTNSSFISLVTSWKSIKGSLLVGLFLSIFLVGVSLLQIKKIEEDDEFK